MSNNLRKSAYDVHVAIMRLIRQWADDRSKDPVTKVGACVYDVYTGGMFLGYNGFARGIADTEERWQRPTKYDYVIHAEENALLKAVAALGYLGIGRCTMYCTHKPCFTCMSKIIQSGICTVYYHHKHDDSTLTDTLAEEGGCHLLHMPII
jgi:dCMP deaminase